MIILHLINTAHAAAADLKHGLCSILILTIILLSACSSAAKEQGIEQNSFKSDDLVLWVFGDLQPRSEEEREDFDVAVDDIASLKNIDAAICMGDIIQHGKEYTINEEFDWFYKTYSRTGIRDIYEIAGNHDARNIEEYLKATGKPLHYSLQYGNLIIILLSDEEDSSGSDIPDDVFLWWKSIVEDNRESIIITVTHSHVQNTGFCYNFPSYRNLQGSERFTEVLKNEKVELWLFGHTHIPSCLGQSKRTVYSLNGTVFINAAAIREDYFFSYSESRIVILKNGSDRMIVKFRDHRSRKYRDFHEVSIRLKTRFRYTGEKPVMNVYRPGQSG
ncbi:MAG TPA: metallophosphoesterase [Spirochaetota bacterium]|nr:metallophosphoesterase [Spirochaetota bacterium]